MGVKMTDKLGPLVDYIMQDEIKLRIAFEIHSKFDDICKRIVLDFIQKLKKMVKQELGQEWMSTTEDINKKNNKYDLYFALYKPNWKDKYRVGIADYDSDRVHIFIRAFNGNLDNKLLEDLNKHLQGSGNSRHWFKTLRNPYNKWDNELDGFKKLALSDEPLNYIGKELISISNIAANHL